MIEIPPEYPGKEEAKVIFAKVMLLGIETPKLRDLSFYQCDEHEVRIYWQAYREYIHKKLTGSYDEQ
jgi:hypothetical protein